MALKEIFCQDRVISTLQKAFAAGRVPHAYIFAGQEGIGKFKTACEWAKLLVCKNPVVEETGSARFADSCGSCRSCQMLEAGSHPDFNCVYKELREFTKDGKGKAPPIDLPIDVVREFLIAKIATRPTICERKVFIVSEAEKLNAASQNCLLKVLEEPPEYCCIILLCTRLEKLLPTTKSRCQIIRFGIIDEERIVDKLNEMGIEKSKALYFARLAQGSLGQGCQLAQLELADANLYETKKGLLNWLSTYEFADALELAEKFLDESKKIAVIWTKLAEATSKTDINRRAQKILVEIVISALSDAMRLKLTEAGRIINFDQQEQIKKLAVRFNHQHIAGKITDAYKTMRWIDSSVNEKLIFEQMLLNLADSDKISLLQQ